MRINIRFSLVLLLSIFAFISCQESNNNENIENKVKIFTHKEFSNNYIKEMKKGDAMMYRDETEDYVCGSVKEIYAFRKENNIPIDKYDIEIFFEKVKTDISQEETLEKVKNKPYMRLSLNHDMDYLFLPEDKQAKERKSITEEKNKEIHALQFFYTDKDFEGFFNNQNRVFNKNDFSYYYEKDNKGTYVVGNIDLVYEHLKENNAISEEDYQAKRTRKSSFIIEDDKALEIAKKAYNECLEKSEDVKFVQTPSYFFIYKKVELKK